MSVKRVPGKTGRPAKVPGEKSTKEKIFEAAIDLFAERGFECVSVRDIARAVGIKESSVYKHYPSKDAILEAIFAYVEAQVYPTSWTREQCVEAIVDSRSFEAMLMNMPRFMIAEPFMTKISRIMVIEMYHNEKIRDYVHRELFVRPVDETEELFRMLMEAGKIRPCDPRALSTLFISYLIYWYFEAFIFDYGNSPDYGRFETMAQAQVRAFADMFEPERVQ